LIFDEWLADLPNIRGLTETGAYGELESIIPPITVPAWTCMMTSKDPGELGCYGFRNRSGYSYDGLSFANSLAIKEDTVWDILTRSGKRSILIGVPQTYPPKPLNGYLISCFLAPSTKSEYTYPPELKEEIERVAEGYMLDVENFRSEDKRQILDQIYTMTRKRFKVARHLITSQDWDFFMMVEMGIDRIQHGFWKYFDTDHFAHEPGSEFQEAIRDYHRYIDQEIGALLSLLDRDTIVMVVSDHGAQRMDGGICVNEWLIREGYLALKEMPQEVTSLAKTKIDWNKTLVWGEGGYYSRLFLNVKGREPQGIIEPENYEKVREELKAKLEALGDERGASIGTKVHRPQDIYRRVNGIPPDLIAVLGNLRWRSVGSVGHGKVHTFENDTGPDDANHSQYGIFIMSDLQGSRGQRGLKLTNLHLADVAPTVLDLLGLEVPKDMHGKVIRGSSNAYSREEEEEVRKRLEALGYID
jgi:predicted AlkP superfamily phosphohydrolase/phosphomutase